MKNTSRRNFLKKTSLSAAAFAASGLIPACEDSQTEVPSSGGNYMGDFIAPKLDKVRIAFIGVGKRGGGHLKYLSGLEGTEVVAISDLYEDNVNDKIKIIKHSTNFNQHPKIQTYWGSDIKWKAMLNEVKPDAVFISTNWKNHAPMAIESMKNGAHAFVEVPLATSIKDLWSIIDTSERTQRHCMMMENVNYGRTELMYLNMCRNGLIGDFLHAEAAYIHELRWQMNEVNRSTGSWRTPHYANGKGNLYPTHGLGPVAQYMSLARGEDNFKSLISYSTPALGRAIHAKKNFPDNHKWNQLDYMNGDMNTSIIKTLKGRTILVQWDETSPRPYSRLNLIQGTKGVLAGFPTRIALEGGFDGLSKDHYKWIEGEQLKRVYDKFDHPLYKRLNKKSVGSGHGGMDGIMRYRIIESLRKGMPIDQNVYEGAFWSAVTELSGRSVDQNGAPQQFPDFTRGKWKSTNPLGIIN